MEEVKNILEDNGPNKAFHCKLNIKDERIIGFFLKNCNAAKFYYNYARKQHGDEYKIWNRVREEKRAVLKEQFKDDTEGFEKAFEKFCKSEKKNYITKYTKIRDRVTARKNANEDGFAWLKKANATACSNAIYFDYKAALKRFNKNYEDEKIRVENKKKRHIANGHPEKAEKLTYPFAYGFPRYRDKSRAISFHLDNIKITQVDFERNKIYLPGLPKWMKNEYNVKHDGYVKIWHNRRLPKFNKDIKELSIPTISTDGIDWYLSVSYYEEPKIKLNNDRVLGIDLGLKESIITSDGVHYANPANGRRYLILRRRLRYLQRALSKNLEKSPLTKDLPVSERWKDENKSCKAKRLEKAIKIVQIKIKDMFNCQRKQMAAELLKDNPAIVVVEKLNVKGMQKSKKIAPKLQETAMAQIRTFIINACKRRGIEVFEIEQNKAFASTQICSNCGYKNTNMAGRENLNKRVFKCPNCGYTIDRDENAAINLRDAVKKHPDKLIRL